MSQEKSLKKEMDEGFYTEDDLAQVFDDEEIEIAETKERSLQK